MVKKSKYDMPVSFRLPPEIGELLEEAKWQLRMSKVDVVKAALTDFFKKHGIELSKTKKK